jgi:hypothetical protein
MPSAEPSLLLVAKLILPQAAWLLNFPAEKNSTGHPVPPSSISDQPKRDACHQNQPVVLETARHLANN